MRRICNGGVLGWGDFILGVLFLRDRILFEMWDLSLKNISSI
jgi:hypothetical protein